MGILTANKIALALFVLIGIVGVFNLPTQEVVEIIQEDVVLGASPTTYTITDASYTYLLDNENCGNGETHGTVSDGAQGTVYYATCGGRSDQHIFSLSKTLTWESMGVDVGDEVSTVDGSFKYRQVEETHTDVQGTGRLEIWAGATLCATLETTIDPTPTSASYSTHDATGAQSVDSACVASDTSIEIRVGPDDPMVETGNNSSASAELRWDDVSLTIVHAPVAGADEIIRQGEFWF